MKNVSPAMLALLATRQFFSAYLYTFTLVDGTVLQYTSGDADIVFDGDTYSSGGIPPNGPGPWFNTDQDDVQFGWRLGVQVDTMALNVLPGSATFGGVPLQWALRLGVFDGATLLVDLAIMPTYGDMSAGVIPAVFVGRVADVDFGRTGATMNINSHLELLNQDFPNKLFQAGCVNTLYDSTCAVNRAAFTSTAAAAATSTQTTIKTTTLAQATGYFDLGVLTFTSGVNNGFSRSIKTFTQATTRLITLASPMPSAPGIGDTFTIVPGCDKLMTTCSGKFANIANFRGMPYVPQPETAF